MTKKNKSWNFVWKLFAVALLAFGASLLIFFPDFFNNELMKNLELRSDSKTFADWKSPSIPLFMDVYVFNWTNPESIKIAGIKPHFQQLGPYRFQEVRDKLKINFSDDKSEVSYREISHYYFLPEESNGTMDDMFTTVNLIALGAVSRAQYWNFFKQKSVSISLKTFGQEIHITKSIREMLFDGYEDSMLSFGKIFENDTPFTKAGLMIEKNGTDILSGNFTTFTGTDDISKLGLISKLNNTNENSYFEGECKKIKGSTGEFYPPNIKINKPIELFQQKLCRSLTYEYEKDVEVQGILGHRFSLGERAVDNGTVYAENKCFQIGENLPSGLLNISICNYDFPMFMSYPHFYMADESYLEAVEGLTPNKNLHESFMSLEPTTGITLEVAARIQMNFLLAPYANHIGLFEDVPRTFMPVFWVESLFSMDEDKANQLKYGLNIPQYAQIFGVFLIGLGILITLYRYCKQICRINTKNSENLRSINNTVINEKDVEKPLMSPEEIMIIHK